MSSIKIWGATRFWHAKCSLPVAVRVSKTRVLKLPNIIPPDEPLNNRGVVIEYYQGWLLAV